MIAAILLADRGRNPDGTPLALRQGERDALIEWQVAELFAGGVNVVEVVLGDGADEVIPLVSGDNVEPIVNDRWADGEASSLRVGATATPRNTDTAVIVWLRRPREAAVIEATLREHQDAGATVTRPFSGDTPGSPVCIDGTVLARVRNIADGVDVEEVLRDYDTLVVRVGATMVEL
jgi:CTP:molybdopterin cytidylyltransferase MocA